MPKYWGNKFSASGVSPKWIKSKRRREKKEKKDTPGTWGGLGGRDRTLAVKRRKKPRCHGSRELQKMHQFDAGGGGALFHSG